MMGYSDWRATASRAFRKVQRIARLRRALAVEGPWELLESKLGKGCLVLLYHHVGPFRPGTYRSLTVSSRQFRRQVRWLARHGYVGIRPSQWLRWFKEGTKLPEKAVIVTFDDAYADIAEFALPILLQNGFGGCVFVVTGLVGGTNFWDQAKGCGTLPLMSADQIRFWADNGIEFGAHSRTHEDLTALSPGRLTNEVMGSKKDLEDLLGYSVTSFAYPYGAHNEAVREVVQVGFDLGFSTTEGINFSPSDRHLLLRNYVGPNDSLFEFGLNVQWGGRNTVRDVRFRAELNP